MRKILKNSIIIALIAIIFMSTNTAYAQTDMLITNKTYVYVGNETTGTRREAKFGTNKGYAYCITPQAKAVSGNVTLNYVGVENNPGLLYLIENAQSEEDASYLVTQLAIWKYTSNYLPDYYKEHANLEVLKEADKLVEEAKKHSNYTYPSIEVELSVEKSGLTTYEKDENYVRTEVITAHIVNGQSSSVKLYKSPVGTKIVTKSGEEKKSLMNNDEFYVIIPKKSIEGRTFFLELEATASGSEKYIERYSTGNSEYQDLVIVASGEASKTQHVELFIEYHETEEEKNICEKVNGKYYGKDGKETDKETYLTQCEVHKCENVDGTYFDANGNITDEETYETQCFKHVCEKVNENYFDANGNKVSYDEFRTQCETLVCEIVNGKYFGAYGKEVSENEFKSQCEAQIVPVPNTKATSIISMVIGSILLFGVGLFVKKSAKN